jgi:ribonuclease HI
MRFANPSNNEAEYEAVLHGMRMAKAYGATRIKIHEDSNLIAQQVMKECDATCANMIAYRAMYDKLEGDFEGCEVTHIGRESNEEADSLANIGLVPSVYRYRQTFSSRRYLSALSRSSQSSTRC